MTSTLSPDAARTICEHMNNDHADAIAGYASRFARLDGVKAARMTGIDADGMDLEVELADRTVVARVEFDHALTDAMDARQTLIAMTQLAT